MILSRRILKFIHGDSEKQRMKLRQLLSRTEAEVEDLNRTIKKNGFDLFKLREKRRNET